MTPIRYGVCGLGRIGQVHCRHFTANREHYRLVAVCDRDRERAAQVAAEHGGTPHEHLEDFLAEPDMELAILATRSLDHAEHALQALAAGKMVLLEKPIAVTANDLRKLEQADRDYPGRLFFLHNHRFEPAFETIRSIIDSGLIGRLQVVKLCRHHPYRRRADWQTLLSCGGGQLSCWGPHLIDQALQYIGAPVKEVWSYLRRLASPGDADDHVRIILTGTNGIVAEIEISDAVTLPEPYCIARGDRGGLVCADEKQIRVRAIDPAFVLPDVSASAGQPPPSGGYGNNEPLPWIDKVLPVEPAGDMWRLVEDRIARHLFDAIRRGVTFPIRNADAFEVVGVTEQVKRQNPQFAWIG